MKFSHLCRSYLLHKVNYPTNGMRCRESLASGTLTCFRKQITLITLELKRTEYSSINRNSYIRLQLHWGITHSELVHSSCSFNFHYWSFGVIPIKKENEESLGQILQSKLLKTVKLHSMTIIHLPYT